MERRYGVRAAAAAAILAATATAAQANWLTDLLGFGGDGLDQCRASVVAGGPGDIGGPFELVNTEGETVTEADVLSKPSLVYFGYTFCPDVCPLDVARNAQAVDLLAEQGLDVQPVFISVDPDRDTPEVLGDFAANMHEDMVALTGTEAQVKVASDAYRTYFSIRDTGDEYYLVDHSTFTYLMLPDHGFVEFFRREASPEEMAEKVACFVEAS
ncbi:SCO family protein [Citreimonas salinaria]|uniref:Protein SCO1/2 n=1 Tax=Citreimonas salinaria TaxID=321339 RepID=A0A1H3FC58_9RHOB|nr:SCO family protein [Citreimonas salinaria]SDX87774.1 protein SCO1/2 [Citreimonas salinaria]